jgi:acyl carrier protein
LRGDVRFWPTHTLLPERGTKLNLAERVLAIVSKNIETKQDLDLSKKLVDDLGIDSLDTLMIINGLEDEFGIAVNEDDFRNIKTIGDIVTALRQKYPTVEN